LTTEQLSLHKLITAGLFLTTEKFLTKHFSPTIIFTENACIITFHRKGSKCPTLRLSQSKVAAPEIALLIWIKG